MTPPEWQTLPRLLNPPRLAPLALALVAELHGRCGHFPALVNIRPVAGATPMRYEVAEIVNLQTLRDTARTNAWNRSVAMLLTAVLPLVLVTITQ